MFTVIWCPFASSSLFCGRHPTARKFFRMARLQNSRVFSQKSVKKSVELGVRVLRARNARALHALHAHPQPQSRCPFSASFQTFCLTARAYLNAQNTDCFGCESKNGGYFTRSTAPTDNTLLDLHNSS